jgi:hypothetical protein
MDMGLAANERARQTVYSIRRWNFFKGFLGTLVQGERCFPRDLRPETTKLQGGKSDIMSHRSTQRHAMDMGPTANERACQTTYTVKRLDYFKRFLVTLCRVMCKNRPFLVGFGSRINAQTHYGHGSSTVGKSAKNGSG